MIDNAVQLRNVRRNLTSVLLNLPINTRETSISTLIEMLDYFSRNPEEYREMINENYST
jgi:hypothetical protein